MAEYVIIVLNKQTNKTSTMLAYEQDVDTSRDDTLGKMVRETIAKTLNGD